MRRRRWIKRWRKRVCTAFLDFVLFLFLYIVLRTCTPGTKAWLWSTYKREPVRLAECVLRNESNWAGADPKFSSASLCAAGLIRGQRWNVLYPSETSRTGESKKFCRDILHQMLQFCKSVSLRHLQWFFFFNPKLGNLYTERFLVSEGSSKCKATCGKLPDDFCSYYDDEFYHKV